MQRPSFYDIIPDGLFALETTKCQEINFFIITYCIYNSETKVDQNWGKGLIFYSDFILWVNESTE